MSNVLFLPSIHRVKAPSFDWPKAGHLYRVLIEVEYIGLHWDDQPQINVMCRAGSQKEHQSVEAAFCDHDFYDLFHPDAYILASGLYKADIEWWTGKHTDWETGNDESEYGFYLSNLEKVQ